VREASRGKQRLQGTAGWHAELCLLEPGSLLLFCLSLATNPGRKLLPRSIPQKRTSWAFRCPKRLQTRGGRGAWWICT
jgi:hypothetical protein